MTPLPPAPTFNRESVVPATTDGPVASSKAPSGAAAGLPILESVVLPTVQPAAASDQAPVGAAAGIIRCGECGWDTPCYYADCPLRQPILNSDGNGNARARAEALEVADTAGVGLHSAGVAPGPSEAFVLVERSLVENIFRFVQAAAHRERLDALPAFLRSPAPVFPDIRTRA